MSSHGSVTDRVVTPWYVARARVAKADRIVRALRGLGITDAATVATMTPTAQRDVEAAAESRKASSRTWALVCDMLAGSSNPDALCLTCGIGDPHGVDGPRKQYDHPGPCAR